jgi:hypothetical protein
MRNFLWCSPHTPTEEQSKSLGDNLIFLKDVCPELADELINTPRDRRDCQRLADQISATAEQFDAMVVQLGGSPLFLVLAGPIIGSGRMLFAESDRISEDIPQADGSVKKVSIFKHKGWI